MDSTTRQRRIAIAKRVTQAGVALAALFFVVLAIASSGDNLGFSSNHDFYFHVRHPVRAGLISAGIWIGIALACLGGIMWAVLSFQDRRARR